MILVEATVGPFRSINSPQTITIDPKVTALVGMNEAGKTVVLKAMEKSKDALKLESFNPTNDYPRKDLATYLKRHSATPDKAAVLTYELSAADAKAVNDKLGAVDGLIAGTHLVVTHLYSNTTLLTVPAVSPALVAKAIAQTFSPAAQAFLGDAASPEKITDLLTGVEITEDDKLKLASLTARINEGKWGSVVTWEVWKALEKRVPPFLYFSDYDLLPGKLNLADLGAKVEAAKADPKVLHPKHRAVLALLRMADVALQDFAGTIPYEELKAKIESVSINLTDQVMEFWKQNEDLEVEVDIKTDSADVVPYNNGPNLYLRIKNRRHRGVSTSFEQRSRGFIWFFSFLVWFDSVQQQLDQGAVHQNMILLLDEPGLALHALAQADFLRYIDSLAEQHQVIYTTHSPFMVHSDRMHQIRLIEDRKTVGTVVTEVGAAGGDARTIFPLQAALGWTVAQNLFINERNLLVEGPSELLYLQIASALVEASGGTGLRPDVTIVPVGGLDKVVTFVALLGANHLQLAVLYDYSGKPAQKLEEMVRQRLLSDKALFNISQFRDLTNIGTTTSPSDIEDLFEPSLYLAYFNKAFAAALPAKTKIKDTDLPAGDRIVDRLERLLDTKGIKVRPSGGFNHYTVAAQFGIAPPDVAAVGQDTLSRFEQLFAAINAVFN